MRYINVQLHNILGIAIKYVVLFLTNFTPPSLYHKLSQILKPSPMSHFRTTELTTVYAYTAYRPHLNFKLMYKYNDLFIQLNP